MNQRDKRRLFQMAEAAAEKSLLPKMVILGEQTEWMSGIT